MENQLKGEFIWLTACITQTIGASIIHGPEIFNISDDKLREAIELLRMADEILREGRG